MDILTLEQLLKKSEETIAVSPTETYQQITVRMWGNGVTSRGWVTGDELGSSRWYIARQQQFILSKIDARHGAFGLVPPELEGAIVSNDFPLFDINSDRLLPDYLYWLSRTHDFIDLCKRASEGTTNRVRLKLDRFLATELPLPPLDEQRRIVAHIDALAARIAEARGLRAGAVEEAEILYQAKRDELFREVKSRQRIGDLFNLVNGRAFKPDEWGAAGRKIVRIQNLKYPDAPYNYFEGLVDNKFLLHAGDVVFAWSGQIVSLGAHIWRGEEAILNQHIFRIKTNTSMVPEFVKEGFNALIDEMKTQVRGLEMFHIRKQELVEIQFPVLSLNEQRRIVAYLDELQAHVDALKRLQAESAAELDALLPSLLDRAFRGEL